MSTGAHETVGSWKSVFTVRNIYNNHRMHIIPKLNRYYTFHISIKMQINILLVWMHDFLLKISYLEVQINIFSRKYI